jgi:lipocalin
MANRKSRHLAALALVGWYLMMPPDSPKIPHDVDSDIPLARWIVVTSFDTEDNCEKALTDLQNNDKDPITIDKTGKLKRLQKNDAALGKARALNAACVASDDVRLKAAKNK